MNRREFLGAAGCGMLASGCASLVTHAITPVNGAVTLDPQSLDHQRDNPARLI